jgi:hypothetical protein
MAIRTVNKVVTGTTQYDGAGVKLVRVIGRADVKEFDPFLMLDAFDSDDPEDYIKGFPWHPHRGIETVTYLIKGDVEHGDSLGNSGSILDGCCQWMTAGKGILHQEMPQATPRMLGAQLWVNLPQKDKMTVPEYRDLTKELIPVFEDEDHSVRVISGEYKGVAGATQGDYVKIDYFDVTLKPGAAFSIPTDPERNLFVYIVLGAGSFGTDATTVYQSKRALLFDAGDEFSAVAADDGMRFFLFSGNPLREPIAWGGPIVMNTREELMEAFREIENGTFIQGGGLDGL